MTTSVRPLPRLTSAPAPATGNNADAVITLSPLQGKRRILRFVGWSYSAAPTGGRLTISDNGATILDLDIIAGGPGPMSLEYTSEENSEVVITLYAGGVGIIGKLSVIHYVGSGTHYEV